MKKYLALLLALIMVFSITACGGTTKEVVKNDYVMSEDPKEGSVIEIVCNDESKQEKENRILSKMDKLFGK